jgi:hypothetical protein
VSGPGVAPQPVVPQGAQAYQKLLSGGFTADEANQWRAQQTAKLQAGGFNQHEIEAYWGNSDPSTHAIDAMNRGNAAIHQATNPLEMLEAGWQMSVSGLASRGKLPDTVAPQSAGLLSKMLEATGQAVGDLPATVAGFVGGAGAGTAAGAAVPVGGETGATEAIGGVAGAGFGANALPQALREVMIDAYQRGEVHSFSDFLAMATKSTINTAKAGVVGLVSAPLGGAVGSKVLAAGAKPWLATGANMASQAVAATTVGAGLEGHVPNADDFAIGATVMLGFHGAGKVVGAVGGQRFVPNEAGKRVQANLQEIYRRTGTPPWETTKKAQNDPVFRQEVLAQDVQGNPSTPHLNRVAADEPPKPGQAKEQKPALANAGIEDLLPKVRALEGSKDDAISPAGAIGRYQIMPGTARQYGFDPTKLTDPSYNETAARTILTDLYRRFRGDEDAILTAYNAGPGRAAKLLTAGPGTRLEAEQGKHGWEYARVDADRSEAGLPLETQEYLARNRSMGGGTKGPTNGSGGAGGEPPKQISGHAGGDDPFTLDTSMRVSRFKESIGEPSTAHRPALLGLEMELDAARRVDTELKTRGLLDPTTDIGIEDMARSTYASENRADHFFFRGPFDPVTFKEKEGPALKDVADEIKRIGGNQDEFNTYRVALRTIEKAKQGIDTGVFPGGAKEAEANAADPNLKKYAKANDLMQQWKNSVLTYVRDSGGISQKQMDAMIAANTSHVSLRRLMGDDQPFKSGSRKSFRAVNPIARMEGSDKKIIDPWLADIDNARMLIRFADRNRAAGAIVGAQEGIPQSPDVKRLAAPEAKATLAEPGSSVFKPYGLTDKEAKAFEPIIQQGAKGLGKQQFIFYRNGKAEVWQANDENVARLYRAADSPGEATLIDKVVQFPAKIARAGIAGDPTFGPRIALKHQLTAFIADPSHPPPFITMMRGLMDSFGKGDAFWELARTGGLSGSIVDIDRSVLTTDAQKLLEETGVTNRLWNTVRHPLELAQILTDRLAQASRIGYYKNAVGKGAEPMKAAMNARKAYLDYDEKFIANVANTWAKWVPFFKADILGLRQGKGAWAAGRALNTSLYVIMGLAVPQIGLYLANRQADKDLPAGKRYTDLPQWERDNYFITPPIAGQRFRIGKPYVIGPLVGIPLERFIEHEFENNPHAFDHIFRDMSEILPKNLPPVITPIIEGAANYSFFSGKQLIPDSLKDASGDMQYTEATTEPAKALARVLGPHGGVNLADVSPIVVDNYVRGWAGTLGIDVMKALGAPFAVHNKPWEMSDLPFVQSFFVRNPQTGSQPIETFYDDMKTLEEAHANEFLALKRGDPSIMVQDAGKARLYSTLIGMRATLGIQRTAIQAINDDAKMTVDEKRQNTDRIVGEMIGLAQAGSKMIGSTK